ncbi:MAG: tRNA (N(6)-L-threonylcarbamoyladenosine(37)-C(2))-methylthiotransferase MtaB, partial [Syntrophomonadaceae bacterium]|nr:tRNA (N(6)-L-threonylcarbamoyladenosine(37)-C(2))-methylthiotransferase MtaB [Syntrophomonadaceae bacterium]
TAPQFWRTYQLVKDLALSDLHVFKYSPRPGTPAASLPHQVAPSDKEERSRLLLGLARELRRDFASRFLGEEMEVLLEQPLLPGKSAGREGTARLPAEEKTVLWEGYTGNYLRVAVPRAAGADASGQLVRVRLKQLDSNCLRGEII